MFHGRYRYRSYGYDCRYYPRYGGYGYYGGYPSHYYGHPDNFYCRRYWYPGHSRYWW